jgi:transposase
MRSIEIAALAGVTTSSVYEWYRAGLLKPKKLLGASSPGRRAGAIEYSRREVLQFIRQRRALIKLTGRSVLPKNLHYRVRLVKG